MKMEITSMSTKGQVVIPKDIRKKLGVAAGSKFSILTDGKRILLRPLRPAQLKEFQRLIKADNAALKKAKTGAKK
ncbi:MAG: AbrB/MazE/SpoVT family DNA-binding domain-containing protein [Kiritimatiellia bacterium]|jgi:AbrB family looped-hinge helix DNA binding protein